MANRWHGFFIFKYMVLLVRELLESLVLCYSFLFLRIRCLVCLIFVCLSSFHLNSCFFFYQLTIRKYGKKSTNRISIHLLHFYKFRFLRFFFSFVCVLDLMFSLSVLVIGWSLLHDLINPFSADNRALSMTWALRLTLCFDFLTRQHDFPGTLCTLSFCGDIHALLLDSFAIEFHVFVIGLQLQIE